MTPSTSSSTPSLDAFCDLPGLSAEDQGRADFYALISHLFLHPPSPALLRELAGTPLADEQEPPSELEKAWERLTLAAAVTEADAVREEFDNLFVSTGTPRINPYACLYLVGYMNEKPLARLRTELQSLDLSRAPGVHELEDHLSGLCDVMRVMIAGTQGGKAQTLQKQREFFSTYIAPWYSRCLTDIREASGAGFYSLVADFAQTFLDIEMQAFEIEDTDSMEKA